jgi:hypothetical protein
MPTALVMQHVTCMRRIILSSAACPAVPYTFLHYLIKSRTVETNIEKKGAFWFLLQNVSGSFVILTRTEPGIIINYICFHVKYQFFFAIYIKIKNFRQIFDKYTNIKLHGNLSSVAKIFSADTGTDGQTCRR